MSAREGFVAERRARWERLEVLLRTGLRRGGEWSELASLYRALCADLSRAQSLDLPADVVTYLDDLAGRAHNVLYASRGAGGLGALFALVFLDFPRELRAQWRPFLAASVLFYAPFVLGGIAAYLDAGFATSVLPEAALAQMEEMYSTEVGRGGTGEDAAMAGFYVMNNVGIALRCFVTGVFAGLGSIFFLVYNGLVLGVVEGALWRAGHGWNLLVFTAGHTPWELTGVVVAGTAGLRLGWALVATDGSTRGGSLRAAAPTLYRLVVGATFLLLVAAVIEGFWSASTIVPGVLKVAFGVVQVVFVALWLVAGGRGRE